MDHVEELTCMALNALDDDGQIEEEPSEGQVSRWQDLFGYAREEAVKAIKVHRADINRIRISNEQWVLLKAGLDIVRYDREAYEHELQMNRRKGNVSAKKNAKKSVSSSSTFIFKLSGPFESVDQIATEVHLSTTAKMVKGIGEDGEAQFCEISAVDREAIEEWLSVKAPMFKPTFVKISRAAKDFRTNSAYPTLGIDTTMPQHRPNRSDEVFLPTHAQYPVKYFFYGTLGQPEVLARHLNLSEEAVARGLRRAKISGGKIKMWAGKYKALVDGSQESLVDGLSYEIASGEQEDALRMYEMDAYAVARCWIEETEGKDGWWGCTSRFVGENLLD